MTWLGCSEATTPRFLSDRTAHGPLHLRGTRSAWEARADQGDDAAAWRLGRAIPMPVEPWVTDARSADRVAAALRSGGDRVRMAEIALAHGQVDVARAWAESGTGAVAEYALAGVALVEGALDEADRRIVRVLEDGDATPELVDEARLDRSRLALWHRRPDTGALEREAEIGGGEPRHAVHRAVACATLADLAMGRGDIEVAATWSERALRELGDEMHESHGAVYPSVVVGLVALASDRVDEAIRSLEAVLGGFDRRIGHRNHHQALDAARGLAAALRRAGRPDEALAVLLAHRPTRVGLRSKMPEVPWLGSVAATEVELGRAEDAIGRYRSALALESGLPAGGPHRAALLGGWAGALLAAGRPDDAVPVAEEAVEASRVAAIPGIQAGTLRTLAAALRLAGTPDPAVARRALEAATAPLDRGDALLELAWAELAQGRTRPALRALERAAETCPEAGDEGARRLPLVLTHLGLTRLRAANDPAGAAAALEQALALDPDRASRVSRLALAEARLALGDRDGAVQVLAPLGDDPEAERLRQGRP